MACFNSLSQNSFAGSYENQVTSDSHLDFRMKFQIGYVFEFESEVLTILPVTLLMAPDDNSL
jgi:hypothetical protein